jgi:hypothetical protein
MPTAGSSMKQKPGLRCEQHADFEPLILAISENADLTVRVLAGLDTILTAACRGPG